MRRFKVGVAILATALLAVIFAGCGQEVVTVPIVVSSSPAQAAVNVSINTSISASFSMPMNPSTIGASTFTVTGPGGSAVSGGVTYSGVIATFTPSTALSYSTSYTATITTGATSLGGTPLTSNYAWTFSTITPAPIVIAVVPIGNATSVSIGQAISATFSEAMLPSSIGASSFTVTGPGGVAVTGAVSYSGVTATFTPTINLAFGTLYTATVNTGAVDLAGTPLAGNYVWTFTTITPPPAVIATVPVNSATGVPVSQAITATFNEAMSCSTLASPATTFTLAGPGSSNVAGTVSCAGSAAIFTPSAQLAVNTLYTATINTAAKSLAGTSMATNYSWTFRTVPATASPVVISTLPLNGAIAVPTNQILSATFSEAMNASTIGSSSFTLTGPGATSIAGTVTYVAAGSVAIFTPTVSLTANTLYTATITTGAMDLTGTALASNYTWKFTTTTAPVTILPTVVSTAPINLATNVALSQIVSATFSKAMNSATINAGTFKLTGPGATSVSGLVAYAAIGNTLTFTPTANLAPSTLYTATITTGATDLTGNALANNYVWTFTTGSNATTTAPVLVSTIPVNAAANVALNQTVSATFSEAMNPLSLTTATYLLTGPGGLAIPGTITYDAVNFIATFTPTSSLLVSSTYTATLTSGITDLNGNSLGSTGSPNPWSFTTGSTVVLPPVVLGPTASLFGAFGGTAGVTNQGIYTIINGDIGTTAVSTKVTGFHDTSVIVNGVAECTYTETPLNVGIVNGTINTAAPPPTVGCPNEGTAATYTIAAQAALEALTAFNTLAAIPNGLDVSVCPGCGGGGAGELGNRTLSAGTYKAAPGSYSITMGDLTLDAKGDPNASWVFQMATTLTVGMPSTNRNVLLVNGAQAKNVFWQVGSAATINGILGGGTMQGTILSQNGVSISTAGVVAITTLNGRAMVLTGPVTMVNTVINVPAP